MHGSETSIFRHEYGYVTEKRQGVNQGQYLAKTFDGTHAQKPALNLYVDCDCLVTHFVDLVCFLPFLFWFVGFILPQ